MWLKQYEKSYIYKLRLMVLFLKNFYYIGKI